MEKLAERLIEKYLLKDITRLTLEVYFREFDNVLKECCNSNIVNDTTLGCVFRKIELIALERVIGFMEIQKEKISIHINSGNPFDMLIDALFDEFNEHLSFRYYVSSILDDERNKKEIELQKLGLIDENGDYIAR